MEPSFEKALLASLASLEPVQSNARRVGALYLWHIRWVFASKLTLGAFDTHSTLPPASVSPIISTPGTNLPVHDVTPLSGTLCFKFTAVLRFSPLLSHHKMEMSETPQNLGIKEKEWTTKLALWWGNFLLTNDYQRAWELPMRGPSVRATPARRCWFRWGRYNQVIFMYLLKYITAGLSVSWFGW